MDSFILIGGRSSRLGNDKAFVDIQGRTLLQRAIDVVNETHTSERITAIAGNSTQFATEAIVGDVPFIFDLHEGRGPLGGLHAALSYAKSSWIFLLACDYPFVSAELIRMLAARIDDKFGAIVPQQQDGRLQPLCAFYDVETARPIVEAILGRPRVTPPMHEIVTSLNPLIVRFDEYAYLDGAGELFVNINTVDDLERARQSMSF